VIKIPEFFPFKVRALYGKAEDYENFWDSAALEAKDDVYWFSKWDKTFTWQYPTFRWYVGGLTNIGYSCLDYKVDKGYGDKKAFIAEYGETGEIRTVTYGELLCQVKQCAAALKALGVEKGDRVAIYMPMGIEAAVAMLACARIGAIHMVIFAGFSSGAIADRVELSGARYVITQVKDTRRNKPVLLKQTVDQAIERLSTRGQVKAVVVFNPDINADIPMVPGRDILWDDFLRGGRQTNSDYISMESNEPIFVLPTSGTTAKPKIVVHCHGGYQIHIYSMAKWIYGLEADDIWFCTSDIGWIVGHSYNIYAPLLCGCTSILYRGTPDYPQPDMWWDTIERNRVTGIFTSPTGIRALMRLGIEQPRKHDISSVKRVVCAGETLNPAAWEWLQKQVFEDRVPVIDHMWQTETGGPIIGNPSGVAPCPIKPGSSGIPAPGIMADVVAENDGHSLSPGEKGVLIIRKPFPGLTPTLWGDAERYKSDYWEAKPGTIGVYLAGDAAYKDEDGYFFFTGRADEVIKIAAHRIGTIEIENALVSHPAIVEAAVCGVPDELRGEVASGCVVLVKGYRPSEELKREIMQHVRREMGAIVVIKDIVFVSMLPKTRSGKIMRRVIKALLTGKDIGDISTIEEEASVDEAREALGMTTKQ
jgi:acetyl-CoA synthetase